MRIREELTKVSTAHLIINKMNSLPISKICTSAMCVLWLLSIIAMIKDIHITSMVISLFHIHDMPIELSFTIDRLTLLMLAIVTMISLFVHQYAMNYLKFDAHQMRFMLQLSLVSTSVVFFVCSGNLLTSFIGWQLIGFSLYLLLNHYHFEAEANRSAKKKFVINRIGDLCFITAVIVAYQAFGSSEFSYLATQQDMTSSTIILSLLIVAVMTKTAQFPFHIWLPDTMQTPTPVSALMHAGVINAGGILLSRLSPWLIQYQAIMQSIFWIGFTTMLIGAFSMKKQPDVKKKLAYSTMSQMGYMIMQCGIGSFALAIYHLIVHGFFKSSQFLSSGTMGTCKAITYRSITNFNDVILRTAIVLIIGICACYMLGMINNPIYLLFMTALAAVAIQSLFETVKYPKDLLLSFSLLLFAIIAYIGMSQLIESYLSSAVSNHISINALQLTACGLTAIAFIGMNEKHFMLINNYQMSIEKIYRNMLLKPYRKIGKALNNYQLIMLAIIISTIATVHFEQLHIYRDIMLWAMTLTAVIASNKAVTPKRFIWYVLLSQIGILTLLISHATELTAHLIYYYSMTAALTIIPLYLTTTTTDTDKSVYTSRWIRNKLSPNRFYFAAFSILLIGAPGSSMLINELGVLSNLYQLGYSSIALYCVYLLLLTISVLHALQYYVFNRSKYLANNNNMDIKLHIIYITAILFNIINGLYPIIDLGA